MPKDVPLMVTESSLSAGLTGPMSQIFAALWLSDSIGAFFEGGGAAYYHSPIQPQPVEPSCLSLEITETVMVRDAEGLSEVLKALKALGVRLVLDDFGTGYSSLSYLTRLPLDVLKVDRSFVDGLGSEPRDTAITETIIAMSRALSLDVVAEGVETSKHVSELSRLGCGLAQGFHFSRAVPAKEITRALERGPRWLVDRV